MKLTIPFWMKVLKELRRRDYVCMHKLNKKVVMDYTYLRKMVCDLELKGFLISKKKGRSKIVSLTNKGLIISDRVNELLMVI